MSLGLFYLVINFLKVNGKIFINFHWYTIVKGIFLTVFSGELVNENLLFFWIDVPIFPYTGNLILKKLDKIIDVSSVV